MASFDVVYGKYLSTTHLDMYIFFKFDEWIGVIDEYTKDSLITIYGFITLLFEK